MAVPFFCLLPLLTAQIGERSAQPDFSGEWILVTRTASVEEVASVLNVQQPIIEKTVQGAPMLPAYLELIVERRSPRGVRSEKYAVGVESGTVAGSSSNASETRTSVKWAGDSLVIATSRWSGSSASRRIESQRSETWQLDANGSLVITIAETNGQRETRTTLRYRRR